MSTILINRAISGYRITLRSCITDLSREGRMLSMDGVPLEAWFIPADSDRLLIVNIL